MSHRQYAAIATIFIATQLVLIGTAHWEILLGALCLIAIPWYLDTRLRTAPPTRIEWLIASAWIAFRVIACFSVAAFCLAIAYFIVFERASGSASLAEVLGAVMAVGAGVLAGAVGVFGRGGHFYGDSAGAWKRHRENQERYLLFGRQCKDDEHPQ